MVEPAQRRTDDELSANLNTWMRKRERVEKDYADLIAFQEPIYEKASVCGPHCDSLVLHSPRAGCIYCNKYAETVQRFRLENRIGFTDWDWELGAGWRDCPSTMMRSRESINKWHGNVAMTEQMNTEWQAHWLDALKEAYADLGIPFTGE